MSEAETAEWYRVYYDDRGIDRNDVLTNPGVLWQRVAKDISMVRSLQRCKIGRDALILDVGCGAGSGLIALLALGFSTSTLTGVDILSSRVDEGVMRVPSLNLQQGDASALSFDSNHFDLVMESTMFAQLPDEGAAARIASEMIRVTKPNGFIMLADWRVTRPTDRSERALTRRRVARIFGASTTLEHVERGALIPPIGRRLSKSMPSAYFAVQRLAPFLVGQVVYTLRRRDYASAVQE